MTDDKAAKEEADFENRVAAEVRRDLNNDNTPAIERHFEDLLDELTSNPSRADGTGGPNASEREDAERGVRDFCNVLWRSIDDSLKTDSLTLRHVLPEDEGVVITAEDGLGHSWQVTINWEGLEQARIQFGDGPRMLSAIAGRALLELRNARARWWRGHVPLKRRGQLH